MDQRVQCQLMGTGQHGVNGQPVPALVTKECRLVSANATTHYHSMEEGPVKMRSNSTSYAMYRHAQNRVTFIPHSAHSMTKSHFEGGICTGSLTRNSTMHESHAVCTVWQKL